MARVKANDSVSAFGYTSVEEDSAIEVLVQARELDIATVLRGGLAAWFRRRLVQTMADPLRMHWFSASSIEVFMQLASKERNIL